MEKARLRRVYRKKGVRQLALCSQCLPKGRVAGGFAGEAQEGESRLSLGGLKNYLLTENIQDMWATNLDSGGPT